MAQQEQIEMATVTIARRATADEMAREIDRRGGVIERLESQLKELTRDRDAWRERESETQEALQKIGEQFGVSGGEPRIDGIRRVLTELQAENARLGAAVHGGRHDR
jgi:hypothetical protein